MKTKNIKTFTIIVVFGISLFTSVKILKSDYKFLRTTFLIHGKGKTQHFINSFIN